MFDISGVKIPNDERFISENIRKAMSDGTCEQAEAAQINQIIIDGERVLEIGAGVGFIFTLVSRNPKVQAALSYEADPDLVGFIKQVHEINKVTSVEVVNGALAAMVIKPEADFYVREDFRGSSLSPESYGYAEAKKVPVHSFSRVAEEFAPTLIICDIEGGKVDLFLNANLTGVKKAFMEVHQNIIGRHGMKELFDALSLREFHYDQHHSRGSVVLFSHVDR